ncbi:acyltransferase family protein [Micromonospora halophytica]|uniref:Peptidoglycan/LPS O-acetylase OafA/YrhL, contains acyltransferase and SGNH-hydrolase domains n=1 Tax=Micromonospora halophytica TaxID=47864 RepID=A0A1C5HGA8_9ACTN|nr:acyltransferase family protein [Micromonospora halophytica]SCG44963.1 Peptidoglycan/LPS O-acetylase OafA/YrhL, contains acyltransferase and SGNH-hydrolase domains [Micromonospora halophytica]
MAIRTALWTNARTAVPAPIKPTQRVPGSFRGDIEGMRAVAVLLVLLGHAGVPYLPGGFVGVDVFFVISGFLITGLLIEEFDRRGRISLTAFYARRAKRLLPAAATVLLATLLLTYFFLPRTRWSATAWDVVASAGYAMNWRMAAESLDYANVDQAPSILQHFWSLAVEEQFYLVWPLLLIMLGWIAHRRRRGRTGLLLLGLALIALPSFGWALVVSPTDPSAYYVTTTRMWELAVGGAVAVTAAWLSRTPRAMAAPLAWAGLVTVGVSAVLIDTEAGFPGSAAPGPTLGAAAVVAFGSAAGRAGPALLLGQRPLRAVGAISYSLYLWHWPLLIAAQAHFGDLSTGGALAVVAASAIPATLTYHYIENPLRRSRSLTERPIAALQVGAGCTIATALVGLMFLLTAVPTAHPGTPSVIRGQVTSGGSTAAPSLPPGAAVLGSSPRTSRAGVPVDRVASIYPDPLSAGSDGPRTAGDCGTDQATATVKRCVFGRPDARTTLALVGDSHAHQWLPAVDQLAQRNNWRVVLYTKASCPFVQGVVVLAGRPYSTCAEWNRSVRAALLGADRPDLLLVSSSAYLTWQDGRPATDGTALAPMLRRTWGGMVAEGVPVAVLRDAPYHDRNMPECVAENRNRLTRCAPLRSRVLNLGGGLAHEEAAEGLSGVHLIDLTDAICPAERCAPVIGGVLVYRDNNHLTATYVTTLAPRLEAALRPLMPKRPGPG